MVMGDLKRVRVNPLVPSLTDQNHHEIEKWRLLSFCGPNYGFTSNSTMLLTIDSSDIVNWFKSITKLSMDRLSQSKGNTAQISICS